VSDTFSRYAVCDVLVNEAGRRYLAEREPFGFVAFVDNRLHRVVEGDTLFHLAGRYLAPLPRACGLWWVIADFQPTTPILDPTLSLSSLASRALFIPSVRAVTDVILPALRRGQR